MTKNPPKRTFRKKNKMYIPQTLYCPYCGGKAILRPVSYLFGDEVNPGSSEHYYVCTAMRILPAITATLPQKADWLMPGCVIEEMLLTVISN